MDRASARPSYFSRDDITVRDRKPICELTKPSKREAPGVNWYAFITIEDDPFA